MRNYFNQYAEVLKSFVDHMQDEMPRSLQLLSRAEWCVARLGQ